MPHHKSAEKRVRTNEKRRQRNVANRSELRTVIKRFDAATGDEAQTAYRRAVAALDRAAKKGVIKSGTADRKKSRLSKQLAKRSA